MLKRVVKSLILIWGLIITSVYADDIVIKKPIGYTGEGPEQIIIQSMNVWATDSDPYGYYFQRGNNHGFSSSETPTVVEEGLIWDDSYRHKGYGSINWINGSKNDHDVWADKSRHDDVWWGEGDNAWNHWGLDTILETQKSRQGPCDEGYHVPSAGEWSKIIEYWALANGQAVKGSDLKYFLNAISREKCMQDLWLLFAGDRLSSNASLYGQGDYGYYWSSSPYGSAIPKLARYLNMGSSYVSADGNHYRSFGASVRCVKDFNVASPNSYNFDYKTLIIILISFLIGWSVGCYIYHHRTKRRSKSQ